MHPYSIAFPRPDFARIPNGFPFVAKVFSLRETDPDNNRPGIPLPVFGRDERAWKSYPNLTS